MFIALRFIADGNVGRFITSALLKTGKHTITAITRTDSQSKLPDNVTIAKDDYSNHTSLVSALKCHDALVITPSGHAVARRKLIEELGQSSFVVVVTVLLIGRAVAALISLPIKSETEACLDKFRNKIVWVSSFTVNQEDMCASVL
ncbi:hypothetical protein DPSP01_013336 [Paraphaeosphaeria sporulosa]|uniref:NAD(P)-binding domain-containing protein n=1 Tax=Paraphaeosphaeria sporulosa TaxID=1460663 RepID=A0A177D208_9PLEO|nr:uncharacterized protein CC84DRAFT_1212536 [Paraphaeosphaeria sporulosa]OAG13079.1 hypothetical protein CC84DRAFT_1212536 [Paraphaeosphaeria sporulosa]